MDLDVAELQDVEHLEGGVGVALAGRHHERIGPLVVVHPVAVHLVEVVQPLLAVAGHVRHARQGRGDAVFHLLRERPRVLRIRHREVVARFLRAERPALLRVHQRVREVAAGNLGEDARLPVVHHVLPRGRPHIVAVFPRHALLALGQQRRRHRLPHRGLPHAQQRVHVRVEWLGERRHEDARSHGPLLVHVVADDGLELVLHQLDVHACLLLREHEPVAVVVVADVPVVQVGIHAVERRALRLVPVVDHQVLAVGILRRHHQHHRVIEDLPDPIGVLRGQPVDDVDDGLAVADLGGVDGGVDEVEGLALACERPRLGIAQPARVGQPPVDLHQPVELRQVPRRADAQQRIAVSHRRLAQLLVLHPVGLLGQQLEVLEDLRIARQLSVGANREAEVLVGSGNPLLRLHGAGGQRQEGEDDDSQAGRKTRAHTHHLSAES